MSRTKMPRYPELLNTATIIPNTRYVEYELVESIGMLMNEARGMSLQPDHLLPLYSYAVESAVIKEMLKLNGGNQSEVALILGTNRGSLRHLIDRYKIDVGAYK